MTHEQFKILIRAELREIEEMLIGKNLRYGNSALDPVRIFSSASATEQLHVRIDDKLSRLARGPDTPDAEDTVLDLIGYLLMLRVARSEQEHK